MAARIEDTFGLGAPAGELAPASPNDAPPASAAGAGMPHHNGSAYSYDLEQHASVVAQQQTRLKAAMASTSAAIKALAEDPHERAITAAGQEVERHMRLRQDALDRYRDTSDLIDQADADRHRVDACAAAELHGALIRARSPERVAQMLAEQQQRMSREPGA